MFLSRSQEAELTQLFSSASTQHFSIEAPACFLVGSLAFNALWSHRASRQSSEYHHLPLRFYAHLPTAFISQAFLHSYSVNYQYYWLTNSCVRPVQSRQSFLLLTAGVYVFPHLAALLSRDVFLGQASNEIRNSLPAIPCS